MLDTGLILPYKKATDGILLFLAELTTVTQLLLLLTMSDWKNQRAEEVVLPSQKLY